jgi:large subunit ribosomal protein L4
VIKEKTMPTVDVINNKGKRVSELELDESIFNVPVNTSVLHDIVKMQLASKRAGSASVKHRSDVTGSQRKLYRQKGTGRARRGNIKSPLLRGGGSVFGPDPRSYSYRPPKKVRRLALKMALSSKLSDGGLKIIDQFGVKQIKTKDFASILRSISTDNALIIIDQKDETLTLSARNIPNIKILLAEGLNVYDILKHQHLVILADSVKQIEGRLA